MFTGIITDTTTVQSSTQQDGGLTMAFSRPANWHDLELGESIATNGVCLTVSSLQADSYTCHLVPETLQVTAFGQGVPKTVNVERALRLSDRLSGHLVQGHVDGVGRVTGIQQDNDWRVSVQFPKAARQYIIPKGSITINGVSLTVAELTADTLTVALVPYTLDHTTLRSLQVGDQVNLEFDMIGKYVANLVARKGKA